MSHLISDNVHVVENDQGAINAAYQVADFALEGRNERDQKRLLPFAEMDLFSAKGLGGIRIPQKFGGAFVSNKTLAHVFRILNKADSSVGQTFSQWWSRTSHQRYQNPEHNSNDRK